MQLFCFPYAGASTGIYKDWINVSDEVEVIPLELPGRGLKYQEPLITDWSEALNYYRRLIVTNIRGNSYAFFGHSLGALMAYELARIMLDVGHPPIHLFLSGCHAPLKRNLYLNNKMTDQELMANMHALMLMDQIEVKSMRLLKMFLHILRADLAVYDSYYKIRHYTDKNPLPIGILVFLGTRDPLYGISDHGWDKCTSAGCESMILEGGHFFIHHHGKAIIGAIAEKFSDKKGSPS